MVEVKKSNCFCGKCEQKFLVDWDLETMDTPDTGLDMGTYYYGETEGVCPFCGNRISARLQAVEKPIGVLEDSAQVTFIGDSYDTEKTQVEAPKIFFYDR